MNEFKLLSELNPEVKKALKPDLGIRDWRELSTDEKNNFIQYLTNSGWLKPDSRLMSTIEELNNRYKKNSFGINVLRHRAQHPASIFTNCCVQPISDDLIRIAHDKTEYLFIEFISIYAKHLITYEYIGPKDRIEVDLIILKGGDASEHFRTNYTDFDKFTNLFNDLSLQYGLGVQLTRMGPIPLQEKMINEDIYNPVIKILAHPKWKSVSDELSLAFTGYQMKNDTGYSGAIRHSYNAIQAFLQLLVNEEIGKGEINKLVSMAQKKNLIPADQFTTKIFKDMEAFVMSKRQTSGGVHPELEVATEKNAKLMLNITMVFLQHCLQNT